MLSPCLVMHNILKPTHKTTFKNVVIAVVEVNWFTGQTSVESLDLGPSPIYFVPLQCKLSYLEMLDLLVPHCLSQCGSVGLGKSNYSVFRGEPHLPVQSGWVNVVYFHVGYYQLIQRTCRA